MVSAQGGQGGGKGVWGDGRAGFGGNRSDFIETL